MKEADPAPTELRARSGSRIVRSVIRQLPPARIVWVALLVLGVYGSEYLRWVDLPLLVTLPAVAVSVDLLFQLARFPKPRIPDAALATGLFVVLLLPPIAPLAASIAATVAGVGGRHLLRWKGRPLLNPAASAIVLSAVLFGLAPAWWVGIGPFGLFLVIGLGSVVIARTPTSWRFPAAFLITYGAVNMLLHVLTGAAVSTQLVVLEIADPSTLFFALFMMPEPRSAPADLRSKVPYAALAGLIAGILPLWTPALGILFALLAANVFAVALRRSASAAGSRMPRGTHPPGRVRRRPIPGSGTLIPRWPVSTRIGAGLLVLAVLGASLALNPVSQSSLPLAGSGSGGGSGVTLTSCTKDNPSIPSATLSTLHQMLGPSVILAYDSTSGVVKFYDPVNHVTVTETDLNEDYGFAEFNGDDYAVAGCSP